MNNKQVCSGLLSLLLLSACSTSNIWESITGERDAQVVNGGRRAPVLNTSKSAPVTSASFPIAAPQNYVAPTSAPQAAVANPYDNYDASGNALAANTNNYTSENSSENTTEPPKTGNYFTRLIGWDNTPKSQAEPLTQPPSDSVRKSFVGNQYFQLNPNAASAEPQKLSSVPATPTQFEAVKSSLQNDMNQLQSDHATATQAKTELDKEVATGVVSPAPAAPASAPSDTIKPLLSSQKTAAPIPVDSLPEIKVDTPTQDVVESAGQSAAEAPVSETKVSESLAPAATATPAPVAQNQPIPVEAVPSQLPSPEIIKTMRPSRYESRLRQFQNTSN